MEQLLTSAEVCAELRISKATLSRLCAAGTLGCHRIGSQLRFRRVDAESPPPNRKQASGEREAPPGAIVP